MNNEERNPYSPPEAPVADPDLQFDGSSGTLIENGRQVPIGHCTQWISAAFRLFFGRAWKWLGTMIVLFVLTALLSLIPMVTNILFPVFSGGLAYALESQRRTGNFQFGDVFAGFKLKFVPLLVLGLVTLLAFGIMFAVFAVMVGSEFASLMIAGGGAQLTEIPPGFVSAIVVVVVLSIPITAATFLAAPLIMLHDLGPIQALKMSFFGTLKNFIPWFLCGILMVIVVMLSALALLIGLLVTLPSAVLLFYPMYRDIFVEEAAA